jgi:hypothetical protein
MQERQIGEIMNKSVTLLKMDLYVVTRNNREIQEKFWER